jgi:hypothetical protein
VLLCYRKQQRMLHQPAIVAVTVNHMHQLLPGALPVERVSCTLDIDTCAMQAVRAPQQASNEWLASLRTVRVAPASQGRESPWKQT